MAEEAQAEEKKKKGKKGIIIPVVVLLLGLGGGGYFFMSGGKKAEATDVTTTTTEAHGPIVRLDPITLNLADGHVLKVGLALQLKAEPEDEHLAAIVAAASGGGGHGGGSSDTASPMGGLESKALDLAIKELGDMTYEELSKPGGRTHAKEVLAKEINHAYHGDVTEVYFTNFVMS